MDTLDTSQGDTGAEGDTLDSGVSPERAALTPKGRYRARVKLRSALGRTFEALAALRREGVEMDRATGLMLGGVGVLLMEAAIESGITPQEAAAAVPGTMDAIGRLFRLRQRATRSRKVRHAKVRLRRDGHPIPEFD